VREPVQLVALNWRDLAHPQAGGSEEVIDHLLRGLVARGNDVALICGSPVGDRPYAVVGAGGTFSQYWRIPFACATRFRGVDLVVDVENGVPYFSPLWRRRPSVCLVHHVHVDQWDTRFPAWVAAIGQALEQHLMPLVYRHRLFVAVSPSTAESLRGIGVGPDRIRVVEPGVDAPSGPELDETPEPLFVALSRLVPHKRVDLLLEAWRLAQPATGGRLVVAGSGPGLDDLRAQAATIPGAEVVGRVDDETKHRLLGQAWFLVHCAAHEGWGMSILEAAAAGTPTLAADAAGVRDAIEDGVTGVLVAAPPEGLPAAMAGQWIDLAHDADRRHAMGAAARQRAATFTWDRFTDGWSAVIEEATADAGRRPRPGRTGRRRTVQGQLGPVARGMPGDHAAGGAGTTGGAPAGGVRRSLALLRGFRHQFDDPDGFYAMLGDDTVATIERYHPLAGALVVDVGGGPGYFAEAFRRGGAASVFVEPYWDEMTAPGRSLGYGLVGDGLALPFAEGTFDVAHSSNVIEHVTEPRLFLDELVRVVRPGGTVFLAFTNWLSPFGGHETSPWHYLGGERAVRHYERHVGYPPKNRFGESLFPLSIGQVLSWARHHPGADLLDAFPRYYPRWARPVVAMPGVREVVTWNLALVLRRR
jgi:glycosyltransferase involved in cell wall biosynthesis/SAM-dependent methyltransferase